MITSLACGIDDLCSFAVILEILIRDQGLVLKVFLQIYNVDWLIVMSSGRMVLALIMAFLGGFLFRMI